MLPTQHQHVLIEGVRPLGTWKTATGVVLLVAVMSGLLLPAHWAHADDAASAGQGSNETGLKVAAWAFTVPYIIAKSAFAVGGAVVGALGYVFSGGSDKTAQAVWTKSIYGTYIIRPAHLKGDEAVRFVGEDHESQDKSRPASEQSPTESVAPEKK